jgi:L-ribulokinase
MDDNKVNIERLVAIGGVAQKSPFVMQKIADVTGRKIEVSQSKHTGALGAAMHAAVIAGIYPSSGKGSGMPCANR